jgi:hypothetical protein
MNQACQRFTGRPQSSRTLDTTFAHVVFRHNLVRLIACLRRRPVHDLLFARRLAAPATSPNLPRPSPTRPAQVLRLTFSSVVRRWTQCSAG